jgi:hypothetical protein
MLCEVCNKTLSAEAAADSSLLVEGLPVCSWDCREELIDQLCFAKQMDEELRAEAGLEFADPGGVSALRAATPDNPRNLPCGSCGAPNRLTPADVALGYHCDACARRVEQGW